VCPPNLRAAKSAPYQSPGHVRGTSPILSKVNTLPTPIPINLVLAGKQAIGLDYKGMKGLGYAPRDENDDDEYDHFGDDRTKRWGQLNNDAAQRAIEKLLEGWKWPRRDVKNGLGCISPSHMSLFEISSLAESEMMDGSENCINGILARPGCVPKRSPGFPLPWIRP